MKDLHEKPFDEGTLVKLSLYQDYLKEWVPVFLHTRSCNTINIFDFFSGPGIDKKGKKGSPLISIDILQLYFEQIEKSNSEINLFLNELNDDKFSALKNNTNEYLKENNFINIKFINSEFINVFDKYRELMAMDNTANLLFLDQNGFKEITPKVFNDIIQLSKTDFLFFISSSYPYRFSGIPELNKYSHLVISHIGDYYDVHREITNNYKSLVPNDLEYYIGSFSIKKGANIYGLIYGTHHIRGLDKFIRVCWNEDPERGEANFDIDRENLDNPQLDMFGKNNGPKKLQVFEDDLKEKILNRELMTNIDIYQYGLQMGILPKFIRKSIQNLISNKVIPPQKVNISYDAYYKKKPTFIELK